MFSCLVVVPGRFWTLFILIWSDSWFLSLPLAVNQIQVLAAPGKSVSIGSLISASIAISRDLLSSPWAWIVCFPGWPPCLGPSRLWESSNSQQVSTKLPCSAGPDAVSQNTHTLKHTNGPLCKMGLRQPLLPVSTPRGT